MQKGGWGGAEKHQIRNSSGVHLGRLAEGKKWACECSADALHLTFS